MGSSAGLMASSTSFIQAGSSLATAYSQSQAMQAQGDYQKSQAYTNAKLADMNAADAARRGELTAQNKARQTAQALGDQRAAMGASGVDLSTGSALDIQQDTAAQGAKDLVTIRNNAWREAWGFDVQANDLRGKGDMAQMAGSNSARNTLLTGGMNALAYGTKGMKEYNDSRISD